MIKIKVFDVHDDEGQRAMDTWLMDVQATHELDIHAIMTVGAGSPGKSGACFRHYITIEYDLRPIVADRH